jgi:hypothetical protein
MVCGGCFYEIKRNDEARQIKATWENAFIGMFFRPHMLMLFLTLILMILGAIDRSGYINIFGD